MWDMCSLVGAIANTGVLFLTRTIKLTLPLTVTHNTDPNSKW